MNNLKNGFTLIELMIALAVGMIIMTAIYAMINLGQQTSSNIDRRVLTQQDARAALDLMAMEVRMASFNPNLTTSTWATHALASNNAICYNFTTTRKGIQTALGNSILIAMDLNSDGKIGGNAANADSEYIRYNYDITNSKITRRVSCGPTFDILGGTGNSTMISNNAVGVPLFEYFDINGNNISTNVINAPDNVMIGINAIRRVRINIVADVENEDKRGLLKVNRRTYSTDTLVRNHVFSP
ncbi:MAG: prepilin-type N-terminal cleavage/methylation domain-containing protein [Syntrophaceae bacterium]|nr:prepilin-type N-terminal cleavage/methylation domain-containing protein [Syntrophaceae bacterium]